MSKLTDFRLAAPAAALLLGACGGGAGGSLASIPPPPPPPAPTYDSFPLTKAASFQTITSNRHVLIDPTSGSISLYSNDVSGRSGDLAISYDATSDSYTVNGAAGTATFAPADRSSSDYVDTYNTQTGIAADTLVLFNNVRSGASQASAPVKLSYLSYGSWLRRDPLTGDRSESYFLFGYPTEATDVPRSGTATYSTAVAGSAFNAFTAGAVPITGSATFTADFGKATIDTMLTLPIDFQGMTSLNYHGTAPIDGNQFAGSFRSSDDPDLYLGNFAGGFFGPAAQEMGYTFAIDRRHQGTILSWTIGAVVGTKNGN